MSIAAAATSVNTGPTEERGAPGPAGTAAGAGRRRYHSGITASPNAELRDCRTWQTVPLYQPKPTGPPSAATPRTIQPSVWVKESHSRWGHTPRVTDPPAIAHSSGRRLNGASAQRHSQRARAESSAVSGRRSRNTHPKAAYPSTRQVVNEPVTE